MERNMIDAVALLASLTPILFLFVVTYNRVHTLENKLNKTIETLDRINNKI